MGRTDDDGSLVRLYLHQIGGEPLLSKYEEQALAREIEVGANAALALGRATDASCRAILEQQISAGERARQRFVRANLRLVVSVARQWSRPGVPLLDLIQEGNLGLMRAVDRFDYRRGFRFSTYATWWIRQAIRRALADTGRLIRLPVHTGEALARVLGEQHRLQEQPADGASQLSSLASATGMSADQVTMLLRLASEPASISEPIGEDGDELAAVIADTTAVSPADAAVATLVSVEIDRLLGALESRDRKVVSLRFGLGGGEPWTLDAISRALGLSREAVRQSQARALRMLRRVAGTSPEIRDLLSA